VFDPPDETTALIAEAGQERERRDAVPGRSVMPKTDAIHQLRE
jgi:hypothetical protein